MNAINTSFANWRARLFNPFTLSDILLVVVGALFVVAMVGAAIAGTDTTFNAATTTITNWSTGSLGKLASVAGIGSALIGMVLKFDWRLIAGAAGIGLTAATGPGIVSALATAVF